MLMDTSVSFVLYLHQKDRDGAEIRNAEKADRSTEEPSILVTFVALRN